MNLGLALGLLSPFGGEIAADLWVASGEDLLHRHGPTGERVTRVHDITRWTGAWLCLDARVPA